MTSQSVCSQKTEESSIQSGEVCSSIEVTCLNLPHCIPTYVALVQTIFGRYPGMLFTHFFFSASCNFPRVYSTQRALPQWGRSQLLLQQVTLLTLIVMETWKKEGRGPSKLEYFSCSTSVCPSSWVPNLVKQNLLFIAHSKEYMVVWNVFLWPETLLSSSIYLGRHWCHIEAAEQIDSLRGATWTRKVCEACPAGGVWGHDPQLNLEALRLSLELSKVVLNLDISVKLSNPLVLE